MKGRKWYIYTILGLLCWGLMFANTYAVVGVPPSYDDDFANYLTTGTPDEYGRVETVYDLWIKRDKSLMENVRCLFYPNAYAVVWCDEASAGGKLWDLIRYVGFWILFLFIVIAGVNMILFAKEGDTTKKSLKSLIYMWYWAFIFFAVTWILWSVLNIEFLQGSGDLVAKIEEWPSSLMFKVLSFFKILAFFLAVIMMVVFGFKTMAAMDAADKAKKAAKWVVNILLSLVLIKVIDYVYYIAQLPSFVQNASEMILQIAKIAWYLLGAAFVVAIFYSGFLLLTDQWSGSNMKKATNTMVGIFLTAIVVFLFLLITYQIFNEFAGT